MTLKNLWRRYYEWDSVGPGKFFDIRTYFGNFRILSFWCVATYFMWHFEELLVWLDKLEGIESHIDVGRQSWARLWTAILGGGVAITSIVSIVMITINRQRWQEITERQWRTLRVVKPEDLAEPNPETHEEPVRLQQDEALSAVSATWNDEPQEPTGIRPPTNAEPPERFGNARLEKNNGRATLIVSKKH